MIKGNVRDIDRALSEDRIAEAESRFAVLEQKLRDGQRQLDIDKYAMRRATEELSKNTIAAQFTEYISGQDEAAIEASIETAQTKTAAIRAEIQAQRIAAGDRPYAPEEMPDVASMSMDQYSEFRLGVGTGRGNPNGQTRNYLTRRSTSAGVLGEEADSPYARAELVAALTKAGRYNISGTLIV